MDPTEVTHETAPTSKRFPTTNQAKACYMYYNSWHQCKYDYSDDEPQCAKLKSWAMSMCPVEWVSDTIICCCCIAAATARLLCLSRSLPAARNKKRPLAKPLLGQQRRLAPWQSSILSPCPCRSH